MDLVSRLKQYLSTKNISITQFADECEIPRPSASQLLAGRNKKVSDEIIGKIHYTYPDLSISWLMFGEGDMVSNANTETSEPQKDQPTAGTVNQLAGNEVVDMAVDNIFSVSDSESENSEPTHREEFSFNPNSFSFNTNNAMDTSASSTLQAESNTHTIATPPSQNKAQSIILNPDNGKRVTGIVVYYSDSTYESFVPDPDSKNPFMR